MYKYVYRNKTDGRKVYSHIPLNYQNLEPIMNVKQIVMEEPDIVLKCACKSKKAKRK